MKTLGLASFAACLVITFTVHAGDDAALKKDQAALQGAWKILKVETPAGKDENTEGATIEFDKDGKKLTFTKDGNSKKGTFKLNPAAKPREIDISPEGDASKTMTGIYQLEKNTLKICICPAKSNDGRPSEFAVKEGKGFVLITLERAK